VCLSTKLVLVASAAFHQQAYPLAGAHAQYSVNQLRVLTPPRPDPFLPCRLRHRPEAIERCAAADVGNDVIAVAVRLPGGGPDGRVTDKRACKTFYGVLAEAARWLVSLGVTRVAMEATGV
jgi:hypothetical protein